MDAKLKECVEKLLRRAAETHTTAPEAVNFSQAALNAAHALRLLTEIDRAEEFLPKS